MSAAALTGGAALVAPGLAQDGAPLGSPEEIRLQIGDRGQIVRDLQLALARAGERIAVDGAFGPRTKAAVERVQTRLGQPATGVADVALLAALGLTCTRPAPSAAPVALAGTPAEGQYLKAFPLARGPYRYSDDFGAPRGQGAHEGIDILAPRGAPIVAVADGAILRMTRAETGLGGIWIWLADDAGNEFYYAHLDTILPGIEPGTRVAAGQQIATNGNTGDARYGSDHLHFEIHPGGGAAINGFRELRTVDPDPDAATGSGTVRPVAASSLVTCSLGDPPAAIPAPAAAPAPDAAPASERPRRRITLSVRQLRINQRISQAAVRRVNQIRHQLGGPAPPPPGEPGRVELKVGQLLINQRISQAAVRRVNAIERTLDARRSAEHASQQRDRPAGAIELTAEQLLINQRISQAAVRRVNALQLRIDEDQARA